MKLKYIILCLLLLFFVRDTFAQLPSCYYSPAEIDTFVLELQSQYPQLVKVDTIGYSEVENKPIYAVKISDHPEIDENEPEILIIGQCHAEEVLGLEFAIRFLKQLMEKYTTGMHTRIWVNELQIYVVPTMNPEQTDGLELIYAGIPSLSSIAPESGYSIRFTTRAPEGFILSTKDEQNIPGDFRICSVFPNPFNPILNVRFYLSEKADIDITIFDLKGRKVVEEKFSLNSAGYTNWQWNTTNSSSAQISSGLYFIQIQGKSGNTRYLETTKAVLMR